MSYKMRKLLCALILIVGLPLYIIGATLVIDLFERPPIFVELIVYVVLGILWALPFRRLFRGIGREDPDADKP
ncbi:MAG: DUF2842 domain-containing protein [Pseudomonadota bacterium]